VQDALNLGASTIDVAASGLNAAISVTSQIKEKLVAASQPNVDRTKIQSEIKQLQNQLKSIADSAVFGGQNWLSIDSTASGFNGTKSIVSSYSHDAAGAVNVGTIDITLKNGTTSTMALFDNSVGGAAGSAAGILDFQDTATSFTVTDSAHPTGVAVTITTAANSAVNTLDISALTNSSTDLEQLNAMTQMVDAALGKMTTAASDLGAGKSRVGLQQSFVSALKDSIDKGIGALVDADMNAESTRLQALQVQQQLGVQALSIANQSSQSILKLFG
jgi:flagellin